MKQDKTPQTEEVKRTRDKSIGQKLDTVEVLAIDGWREYPGVRYGLVGVAFVSDFEHILVHLPTGLSLCEIHSRKMALRLARWLVKPDNVSYFEGLSTSPSERNAAALERLMKVKKRLGINY